MLTGKGCGGGVWIPVGVDARSARDRHFHRGREGEDVDNDQHLHGREPVRQLVPTRTELRSRLAQRLGRAQNLVTRGAYSREPSGHAGCGFFGVGTQSIDDPIADAG